MTRAVLSIGSNVGDSLAYLQSVVDAAGPAIVAVSPVYATEPWGGVEQDLFYNAVLVVDDERDAAGWLEFAAQCESAAERVRDVRWGPRTLDVDVIQVTDGDRQLVRNSPRLTLPHPRAAERAFVLQPWLDVDPDARLPEGSVRELLDRLYTADPAQTVERIAATLRGTGE